MPAKTKQGGRATMIGLALLLDILVGDPPNRLHPTAAMGTAIGAMQRRAPKSGPARQLAAGAAISLGGSAVVAGLGGLLEWLIGWLPRPVRWLAAAFVLKTTLALRGLDAAAREVAEALAAGDLPEARRLVNWHLVSRDTSALDASQVSAATVESVAENASDGVLGPLFYYALGGLPAALAYRYANTCDSMLGYRDAAREWLGKVPARFDDLLNLFPARLTALALLLAAYVSGEDGPGALAAWQRDRHTTASPNAGHPMSAAAGALGIELEKVGHYRLGAGNRPPEPGDVARAARLMWAATAIGAAGLAVIASIVERRRQRTP